MPEAHRIVAVLLAWEASRQQRRVVKAGPGSPPAARDAAAELRVYFQGFLDRIERRDRGRAG